MRSRETALGATIRFFERYAGIDRAGKTHRPSGPGLPDGGVGVLPDAVPDRLLGAWTAEDECAFETLCTAGRTTSEPWGLPKRGALPVFAFAYACGLYFARGGRLAVQFLIKGIYTYNGMLYVHTQTKNSSNVPFDTDFIKFKITDKKVPKRTAIQETVLDAVRSYNEVIEIAGKSTVRTVYALPKFTIPDDKLLVVELYEKNGGRHQTIRVENADIVNAEVIDELKIK